MCLNTLKEKGYFIGKRTKRGRVSNIMVLFLIFFFCENIKKRF